MSKGKVTVSECKQTAPAYRDCLDIIEKARYDSKLKLIDGNDPYELKSWSSDVNLLPKISYPDIVNYLVFSPSPYTLDDLKSYKGLDAYNQFISGWVRELSTVVINKRHVVMAKVLHSQRLKEKPLIPWVISEADGKVIGAHCNCMAGLGEACTHVGALLFTIEGTVKVRDSRTVTQEPAYWMPPSAGKVCYNETRNINFASAKSQKGKFDETFTCTNPNNVKKPSVSRTTSTVSDPSAEEMSVFYESLYKTGVKCAVLSLIPPYADEYVPESVKNKYPMVLTELRNENTFQLNYMELLHECAKINIRVNQNEADAVQLATRDQANSKQWFSFRSGRITASRMKAVCSTDLTNPSQTLVKAVCYPDSKPFTNAATKWGCAHEKIARETFLEQVKLFHDNVTIDDSGLVISTDKPYIAASPDGIVSCDCCGRSCLEIKCPFCVRHNTLSDPADAPNFLLKDANGSLKLDNKHSHFYQVQTQMGVTGLETAYFVVWTECDIHVERISFDATLWQHMCEKSNQFFNLAVLPELVGKFYSRLPTADSALSQIVCPSNPTSNCGTSDTEEETWCYCGQVESGRMICCENENCSITWFHYKCLKMSCAPKGKWFCPDCRKLRALEKKRVAKPCQ